MWSRNAAEALAVNRSGGSQIRSTWQSAEMTSYFIALSSSRSHVSQTNACGSVRLVPGSQSKPRCNIEKRALIGRSLAQIGIAVGAQYVDGAAERLLIRPLPGHEHDPGQHLVADLQYEPDFAALVEQPHPGAIGKPALLALLGRQHAIRLTFAPPQKRDTGISRVRLEIPRRGQQAQWPARRIALLLRIGPPIRHRRETRRREPLRIEFEFARWRTKCLLVRRRDVDWPAAKHIAQIEPGNRPGGAAPQFADCRLGVHTEYRAGDPHSPRQFLRQPEIRPGLALRHHRRRCVLHVIGAISPVD